MLAEMNSNKKTIIITGGNSGLGFACARNIAKANKNYHVILACRNADKAREAVSALIKETSNNNITSLELDLSSLEAVRNFVSNFSNSEYPPLYALVCNAGLIMVDKTYYTKDGFESTFGTNHLGHFLLANMLLEKISDDGRIVFVSSGTHDPAQKTIVATPVYENARLLAYPKEMSQDENMLTVGQRRYSNSKLCNIYCTYELAERIKEQTNKNITVNAFNPGQMPGTGFSRTFPPFMRFLSKHILPALALFHSNIKSADISGKDLASLIINTELKETTGKYFDGTRVIKSSELSYNKENRKDLWRTSIELTKLKKTETILNLD
ncbi:SDR family NAD(P)-dependent oxidoreductase [Clostridium sp. 'White wine YQ']|uniref:SDR family NAD(P)-dependent oxidoreductase n=1 Tax=Clostridium sp. 'White wine YQ' TaxID=3027474 RepID=UPI002365DDCD|nr:SDR family NAD(P)-dependent oxidoreductase [Clostridium sp. 'White wine YQ']MDD7795396.1 SDR family NAD(P)-dependent oxidoreductase [Clostridium sp. 'White wine YQ']